MTRAEMRTINEKLAEEQDKQLERFLRKQRRGVDDTHRRIERLRKLAGVSDTIETKCLAKEALNGNE